MLIFYALSQMFLKGAVKRSGRHSILLALINAFELIASLILFFDVIFYMLSQVLLKGAVK